MLTCRVRVLTRQFIDFVIVLALGVALLFAVASLAGCQVQPVDQVTGQPIGGPVSRLDAPTTSPAGNPVVLQDTDKVDVDRVVKEGSDAAAQILPSFGPYGQVAAMIVTGLAGAYIQSRRKKKAQ
jgi:hypothetical protein